MRIVAAMLATGAAGACICPRRPGQPPQRLDQASGFSPGTISLTTGLRTWKNTTRPTIRWSPTTVRSRPHLHAGHSYTASLLALDQFRYPTPSAASHAGRVNGEGPAPSVTSRSPRRSQLRHT